MINVNRDREFNQHTGNTYDKCEVDNSVKVASKPMRYFTSVLNSPNFKPDVGFTSVGSAKVFNVTNSVNDIQRPMPTNFRDPKSVYVMPYSTTPNLGTGAPSRIYADTGSNLRMGLGTRDRRSNVSLADSSFSQWAPNVDEITVQNAGQFNLGSGLGSGSGNVSLSQFNNLSQFQQRAHIDSNNVIFANGAWPREGISSRNIIYNAAGLENPDTNLKNW